MGCSVLVVLMVVLTTAGYGYVHYRFGQIRSVKDGRNRRILPEWVDDYIRSKVEEMSA